jgi:hypothetical protein
MLLAEGADELLTGGGDRGNPRGVPPSELT